MQLNNMFLYSFSIPLIILILIYLLRLQLKYLNSTHGIKRKYLRKIKKLNTNSYNDLTNLIKAFVSEISNINLNNYTLNDIKSINNDLSQIIEACYKKEFSRNKRKDFSKLINKTKELIKTWK